MAPKRPLGFGKSSKAKKSKTEPDPEEAPVTNELTVELPQEVDANDPLHQLEGLWLTWLMSDRDSELILNGIVHECDRLLRNCKQNGGAEDIELTPSFYAIYGRSLAGLAQFNTEDSETSVAEYFENALERIENGMDKFPGEEVLLFAKAQIIMDRIPLEYISQMDLESSKKKFPNIVEMLDEATRLLELGTKTAESKENYAIFNGSTVLDILDSLDDLLDIVDNFGRSYDEGLDSDAEGAEEEEILPDTQLSSTHPLYEIKNTDKYNVFWRQAMQKSLSILDKNEKPDTAIRRKLARKLGQSYLMEAEEPISIFTTLEYDSDAEEQEINGVSAADAKQSAQKLVRTAIEYLEGAWDEEDPQTWVDLAEAEISMGNLFEVGGSEQEEWYARGENKLVRANNATHGKYEEVLENLRAK
ncbi:hypothetical protein KL911_002575 [Ogataea haglerorum]|uniref:uncharacterized protein n=1 Tax=Ogataea haglerorum TaxID=1937702 RepID=UPI001C8977AA|nr:uncharacterized protein KL911_002575 [Ogataea haglerorum]KAG7754099.1 hypothetical protein KL911_002575 [Ogataea haglerorum]